MKTIRVASGFIHAILRQSATVPKVDPPRSRCVSVLVLLTLMLTIGIPSAEGQDTKKNALVAVKTTPPKKITLKFATTQPATVHAYFEAELYAKVGGYLRWLHVDIGDEVKEGQKLARIDVPEILKSCERQEAEVSRRQCEKRRFDAEIEVAQAKLEQAQADIKEVEARIEADRSEYNRIEKLVESKAVTQSLRDETFNRLQASQAALASRKANTNVAQAEVKVAQTTAESAGAAITVAQKQLEELTILLEYATLRAPFDGIVTGRNVDPGDLVQNALTSSQAGKKPLFSIVQIDKVRVRVLIPQRDVALADVGDKVKFKHEAQSAMVLEGEISRVSKWLEPTTRTMMVEVDLANPDHRLLPGMFGQATILLEERPNQLVLPVACIRQGGEDAESFVYVVDAGNKVHHVPVKTGKDDGQQIEIVSGLSGQEQVVTGLLGRLSPDQIVRVIH
jgi:HlyD family secretion protein